MKRYLNLFLSFICFGLGIFLISVNQNRLDALFCFLCGMAGGFYLFSWFHHSQEEFRHTQEVSREYLEEVTHRLGHMLEDLIRRENNLLIEQMKLKTTT